MEIRFSKICMNQLICGQYIGDNKVLSEAPKHAVTIHPLQSLDKSKCYQDSESESHGKQGAKHHISELNHNHKHYIQYS